MNERIALISTSHKTTALRSFAKDLQDRGLTILSSGGTFSYIQQAGGLQPVNIATLVGEPILGHRVVTLDRRVFAAVLATDSSEDIAELKRIDIGRIEVVYIGLYPLEKLIEEEFDKDYPDWKKLRENIDIGGPSFLRAAGKGDRIVIHHEEHFPLVLEMLDGKLEGVDFESARLHLAAQAEEAVQHHSILAARVYRRMAKALTGPE